MGRYFGSGIFVQRRVNQLRNIGKIRKVFKGGGWKPEKTVRLSCKLKKINQVVI